MIDSDVNRRLVSAAGWEGGDIAHPIPVPELPESRALSASTEEFHRWCLSLLTHLIALARLYRQVQDTPQAHRIGKAQRAAEQAIELVCALSIHRIQTLAYSLAAAAPIDGTPGQEVGWLVHSLLGARQLESVWAHHQLRRHNQISACARHITDAIRAALPDEHCADILDPSIWPDQAAS